MINNILYLGNNFIIDGGASNIFNQLYNRIKKEKKENVYLSATDLNNLKLENSLELENSSYSKFKILFNYKNYKLLSDYLKENNIKIVYMHNIILELSPSVFLALKKNKVKVIYTLHQFDLVCPNSSLCNMNTNTICEKCIGKKIKWNILKERCSYKGYKYDIAKFLISLEKYFFKIDDIVNYYIVPSEFSKKKMLQEGIKENKIKVIENFVNSRIWIEDNNKNKKNNIIYFGRFSREKNVKVLINAISILKNKIKDIHLFIIGTGIEYENYEKLIKENNLQKNITIINKFLQPIELKDILKEMKISVLPSSCYESFGLTIIESIYANVIPIATNIGAMKETIEKSCGVTFENNNCIDLAQKIEEILKNYDKEINNLLKNKKDIKKYYSIENYIDKLNDIF